MLERSKLPIREELFRKDNETEFAEIITSVVQILEQSNETIYAREGTDLASKNAAMMEEIAGEEETQEIMTGLMGMLGEDMVARILDGDANMPSEDEYEHAKMAKDGAGVILVDHVVGFHDHLRDNMIICGMDNEFADEEAWNATWRKLQNILGGQEHTLLAEATKYFDDLVREKYGRYYRPIEEDRGPVVSQDTCARTFYEVLGPHVPRAIIGASRDEWTGL